MSGSPGGLGFKGCEAFCSVGLQADYVHGGTCPPEGGRYVNHTRLSSSLVRSDVQRLS
jgi:hypothetical protein